MVLFSWPRLNHMLPIVGENCTYKLNTTKIISILHNNIIINTNISHFYIFLKLFTLVILFNGLILNGLIPNGLIPGYTSPR